MSDRLESGWFEVMRAPLDEDLSALCGYLQQQGIAIWVFERDGEQSLCVPELTDTAHLKVLIAHWQTSDTLLHHQAMNSNLPHKTIFTDWRHFPVTLLLVVSSVLSFLMVATSWGQAHGGLAWLVALTLQSVTVVADDLHVLAQLPLPQQFWRYWTPLILHFSFAHILFNGLMLLEIGRRIEMAQGSLRLFLLVLICGVASNLCQFLVAKDILFGGLSGLIYALIGYGWLYQRLAGRIGWLIAPGLMGMALCWQLLCYSGLVSWVGLGNIANTAHVSGLMAGLLFAGIAKQLDGSGLRA